MWWTQRKKRKGVSKTKYGKIEKNIPDNTQPAVDGLIVAAVMKTEDTEVELASLDNKRQKYRI